MSIEDRIRHLLRAASRVEREGNSRLAELFRQMAEEALPVNRPEVAPSVEGQSDS